LITEKRLRTSKCWILRIENSQKKFNDKPLTNVSITDFSQKKTLNLKPLGFWRKIYDAFEKLQMNRMNITHSESEDGEILNYRA